MEPALKVEMNEKQDHQKYAHFLLRLYSLDWGLMIILLEK